jgi:mono/diheme cytochrome c family protein
MDRNPLFANRKKLLLKAADDSHGRVRMEAVVAASFTNKKIGSEILTAAESKEIHKQYKTTYDYTKGVLENAPAPPEAGKDKVNPPKHLSKKDAKLFVQGAEIFNREAHCVTCHQVNGKGLPDSGLPPLVQSSWVTGDSSRLIKLTLKGLMGPIEVNGRKYPGQVPMTPFEYLLNDDEIASVLTYTRNAFGNKASAIQAKEVARVRKEVKSFIGLYKPEDLLKKHPIK